MLTIKIRKIIFSCGIIASALLCTSTALALTWYSSAWTLPKSWHRATRTIARKASGDIQWTKVTNVSNPRRIFSAAIYKNGWRATDFVELTPGKEYYHDSNADYGDSVQAAFCSNDFWNEVQATIHWSP